MGTTIPPAAPGTGWAFGRRPDHCDKLFGRPRLFIGERGVLNVEEFLPGRCPALEDPELFEGARRGTRRLTGQSRSPPVSRPPT
jgi:hypothetical protein